MAQHARYLCCFVFFTACLAVHAGAQENKRDPKVQTVLDQMMTAYKNIQALHLKATMKVTGIVPPEIAEGMPENVEFRLQRPNKIWLESTGRHTRITIQHLIVSDGEYLWRWETGMNAFTKTKSPSVLKEIDNLPNDLPEFEILFDEQNPFKDMLLEGTVTLGTPIKQNDVDVDVLEARMDAPDVPSMTLKIMVGQKDHLVRGGTISGKGKHPMTGRDFDFKCELIYSIINATPTFTPADFVFTPPPGIKSRDAE
jgi:outer membrane lipoprotein-sorting protein